MALALKIKDINNYNSFAVYNGDGIIKPEVVLYDEILTQDYYYAFKNIPKENALIVAGTSLTMEPACGSIEYFKGKGFIIK